MNDLSNSWSCNVKLFADTSMFSVIHDINEEKNQQMSFSMENDF